MNVTQEGWRHPWGQTAGVGTACGTFGELLQGVLPKGEGDFLVTLPITRSSRAVFISDPQSPILEVFPPHKRKSHDMAVMVLDHFGLPRGGILTLDCYLPEGKGLASSSADLVATARALRAAFDLDLTTDLLLRFMGRIEPSDGVMFDEIVSFYHRRVALRRRLGSLPPLTIVAVDEGGEVDTLKFNRLPKPFTESEKVEYGRLLDAISEAIGRRDLDTVGQVATRSAVMNQRLRPKRHLEAVMEVCCRVGGLGTVVTHSGTCIGVLLSPLRTRYAAQFGAACRALVGLEGTVAVYHSRGGLRECREGGGRPCCGRTSLIASAGPLWSGSAWTASLRRRCMPNWSCKTRSE